MEYLAIAAAFIAVLKFIDARSERALRGVKIADEKAESLRYDYKALANDLATAVEKLENDREASHKGLMADLLIAISKIDVMKREHDALKSQVAIVRESRQRPARGHRSITGV